MRKLIMGVLVAGGVASGTELAKPKECPADENDCNVRPEMPKTRALKQKKTKECADENTCR